jgi:signal transduction histidine kinase
VRRAAAFSLIAIAMWAMIALVLHQARREEITAANAAGDNLARSLAEYEASSLRAIDLSLKYLRDDWMRDPGSFGVAVERHQEHLKREGAIQVAVIDAEGWTRYSRLPMAGRINFSDREYYKVQKQRGTDELYISAPVFGRVTGQWAIQFTRPIYDHERQFAGVMIVAVPPPALELIYKDIHLGPNGVITLARSDGEILARTGDLATLTTASLSGARGLSPESAAAGHYMAPSRVDGVDRFTSYRRLDAYPLTLFVGQSVDAVLAPYYRQRNSLIGGGVLATLLLLAVMQLLVFWRRERDKVLEGERKFVAERERLMLELHDSCIQSIYAIGLNLEHCRRLIEQDPAKAARTLAEAGANLNLVIQELRAFIAGETHAAYTGEEFMAEIERMIPQSADPAFSVDIDPAVVKTLSADQAVHLLRIAREGISNIVRHANATSARILLQRRDGVVYLEVSDDGNGLPAEAAAGPGLGLHHISARGRKLGGRASVVSAPNQGTRIAVEFPQPI